MNLYASQVWYWETAKAPEGTDILFMPSIPYKYGTSHDLLQAAGQGLDASAVLKVPRPSDVSCLSYVEGGVASRGVACGVMCAAT